MSDDNMQEELQLIEIVAETKTEDKLSQLQKEYLILNQKLDKVLEKIKERKSRQKK